MCGIVGIVGPEARPELGSSMLDRVVHRGPNGRGLWSQDDVVLGHVRLSIIDLSDTAGQPMVDPASGNVLVFNGEIYNYRELRDELRAHYPFRTQSDTEVILAAYSRWGEKCLCRLRGMFAFALWDTAQGRLLLARDRFGIKPLYYRRNNGCFLFCSEIKGLFGAGVPAVREDKILQFFLARRMDTDEGTFFRDIFQLRQACFMWVNAQGGCSNPRAYWHHPPLGDVVFTEDERVHFLELLKETVSLHLRSDVPLGSLLSGGVDSSSIVGVIRALNPTAPIHTYSSMLASPTSENALIPLVNQSLGTVAHQLQLDGSDFPDVMDHVLYHHDEPLADASMYAHYKLCELAKQNGTTVLLSGNGGDEVFGGYGSHLYGYLAQVLRTRGWRAASLEITRLAALSEHRVPQLWLKTFQECLPFNVRTTLKQWEGRGTLDCLRTSASVFDVIFFEEQCANPFTANYLNHLKHWSVPPYLHYEDRNSMALGLEIRVPLLDHVLVEQVARYSLEGRFQLGTKSILREAVRGLVPAQVLEQRGKYGFAAPLDIFLRGSAPRIKELFIEALPKVPFLDESSCLRLAEHYFDHAGQGLRTFWRVYSLARWYRIFNA